MTSSTTGDKSRWGTARRSGMTILGKVAVPKPINLPSQRLENQGLDPNVEIVPKGTLSWGSKSSLNAWGSLSLSPKTESGAGSPSYLSNRPSSGGTGTRPSTAGSDKAHESPASAWHSNSRPSSASGVLTSNQASLASSRPRSAETRPGSSQLSRFAEVVPENSAVWGQHAAEKLGVGLTKNDGFSLTSGDFPSLGAEKASPGKNAGPRDHGLHVRPGSSSGRSAVAEERGINSTEDANVRGGEVDTWSRDDQPYSEDRPKHGIEERQMDPRGPQPYTNVNFPLPPHHFDGWRGPPMNNHPGGVWYRGSPPPYGPPVGPGGFPMDPFPYYPPQISPAPGHGAGLRGNHPTNADMYRPPMPDSYVRPAMPIRPGFYPGPAYEGYYGPPMRYCNPNNRDMPFMGMPPGPYGYNKHSGQGGYDPSGRLSASEQVEPDHSHETRGPPYKVLLKPQDGRYGKDEAKKEESLADMVHNSDKVVKQRPSSNNDRRTEVRNNRNMESGRIFVSPEVASHTWEGGSSETVKSKVPEQQVKFKACGDYQSNKEENAAPGDPSLIQKIEGLNAKARTTDGQKNVSSGSGRGEQGSKSVTINSQNSVNKFQTRNHQTINGNDSKGQGAYEEGRATIINPEQAAISRRSTQGIQARADHQSKGRVTNEDRDRLQKKAAISGSSSAISATNTESFAKAHLGDSLNADSKQKPGPVPLGKSEGESRMSTDQGDSQRSRMRELAKHRALQRQKEEEERARDQRAKALAKLEELNRRTQVVEEDSTMSVETPNGAPENPGSLSTALLLSSSNFVAGHVVQPCEAKTTDGSKTFEEPSGETGKRAVQQVITSTKDVSNADVTQHNNLPHVCDGGASKQKRMGYKQQNQLFEKRLVLNSHAAGAPQAVDVVPSPEVIIEGDLSRTTDMPATSSMPTESTYLKRKNNRNSKKKYKAEEATTGGTLVYVGKETKSGGESIETVKEKAANTDLRPEAVPCHMDSKGLGDSAEQITPVANEEAQGRTKNHWKSQHSRRPQRGSHGSKPAENFHGSDAVIWAPVRAQPKAEIPEEVSKKAAVESAASANSGHEMQTNSRSKRVEMERYVPKPIAKEMAEQSVSKKEAVAPEISQKGNSGSEGTETLHPSGSAAGKTGAISESKHGNGRQNKLGRGQGLWRQRGPVESPNAVQDGQFVNSNQNVQRTVNDKHKQTDKTDVGFTSEQTASRDDEWNDGWNMIPETQNSMATAQAIADGKDQRMTANSKQKTFRGNKGGSNYGEKTTGRDFNKGNVQHSGSNVSQSDLPGAYKENRGPGDRSSSHWQPKTHTSVASHQRADKYGGPESIRAETDGGNKDMPPDRHSHSQNQAPTNKEVQVEQNSNSGFHKNAGQSRHYGRGYDSRGDWGSSMQDNSHQRRPPSSRDRQRQNTHYEYQPCNTEQAKESSRTAGLRYKEKGHNYERHGGERFYKQPRGSVQRDTSYD